MSLGNVVIGASKASSAGSTTYIQKVHVLLVVVCG